MDRRFTKKTTTLLIIVYIFQDVVSSGTIDTIVVDMPSVVLAFEGEDVVLECRAWYANGTLLTYCKKHNSVVWFKEIDGENEFAGCDAPPTLEKENVVFNNNTGSLTLVNISLSDEGFFKCEVLGTFPSVESKTELIVNKALFSVQTERSLIQREGENVTLPCSVIDSGTTDQRNFTYQWLLYNTTLQSCIKNGEVNQTEHGKTSCNLTILNVNPKDEGRYQCDVHDSFYNQSNNNYTEIIITSTTTDTVPVTQLPSTTAEATTNYKARDEPTDITSVSLTTAQELGATAPVHIAWNDFVWVITISSSGLLVIIISLIVVALRLHNKRYSAIPKSQINGASRATVTFRRSPSQGSVHIAVSNQSHRLDDQDTGMARAAIRVIINGDRSSSPIDNHSVIKHYDSGNGVMYTSVNRQKIIQAPPVDYAGVRGAAAVDYQPKTVARPGELVYADLQHTRQHPPNAPPIRTEPPTQYAEIRHNMTSAHHSGTSTPSGHIYDDDDEVELWIVKSEDEAPARPPRGIFNAPLYY